MNLEPGAAPEPHQASLIIEDARPSVSIAAAAAGQPDERIQRQARCQRSARRFAICFICDAGCS